LSYNLTAPLVHKNYYLQIERIHPRIQYQIFKHIHNYRVAMHLLLQTIKAEKITIIDRVVLQLRN
jgi:hypothetical protein